VRIRKVEVLFIVVPVVFVCAIVFSAVDDPKEIGPKLHGQIRQCSGGRVKSADARRCIVDFGSHSSLEVDVPFGKAGYPVTVVKMQKSLSGVTYYAASVSGDP
jgi:hypothetical protein